MKVYRKNEKMDFIRTDEYATAVFDPDSGCTISSMIRAPEFSTHSTSRAISESLSRACAKAIRQIPRTSDRMWKASSRI